MTSIEQMERTRQNLVEAKRLLNKEEEDMIKVEEA